VLQIGGNAARGNATNADGVSVADAVNRAGSAAINRVAVEGTTRAGADAVNAAVTDAVNRTRGSTDLVAHKHKLTHTHVPLAHTRTHPDACTHTPTHTACNRTHVARPRPRMDGSINAV
jgi:hypothetical protein